MRETSWNYALPFFFFLWIDFQGCPDECCLILCLAPIMHERSWVWVEGHGSRHLINGKRTLDRPCHFSFVACWVSSHVIKNSRPCVVKYFTPARVFVPHNKALSAIGSYSVCPCRSREHHADCLPRGGKRLPTTIACKRTPAPSPCANRSLWVDLNLICQQRSGSHACVWTGSWASHQGGLRKPVPLFGEV